MNDVRFHDRTSYDEKVAHMTSDYIDLARELIRRINTAKDKISKDKKIKEIAGLSDELANILDLEEVLKISCSTFSRDDKRRIYRNLLRGRFDIRVCRIDREDDEHTISGKHSDFSYTTIRELIDKGKEDAINSFKRCVK
jgi:NTE family protein